MNGASSGNTSPGFGSLASFTITSGLIAGVNTLDFIVTNAPTTPNPTGLRVDLKGYLNILPSSQVKMSIAVDGSNLSISWTGAAPGQKLQWATDLGGPWNDITNPTNPYTTTASGTRKFFRIAQ